MSEAETNQPVPGVEPALIKRLDSAIARLDATSPKLKLNQQAPLLDTVARVLKEPGGIDVCLGRIAAMDRAGVFTGTDWATPAQLKPVLVRQTLESGAPKTLVVETLSELRFLAIARGEIQSESVSPDDAKAFLSRVAGLNLERLFGAGTEVSRMADPVWTGILQRLFERISETIGYGQILDSVISEVWRILAQRPIETGRIRSMILQLSLWMNEAPGEQQSSGWGADRLISALFRPTNESREDPGIEAYAARIANLDEQTLAQEAAGMARAMYDTGLVSAYHAVLLRHLAEARVDLLPECLGLTAAGRISYHSYTDLTHTLIREAIFPETAQSVYGLSLLLERGILSLPPTVPALWRQIGLTLHPAVSERLSATYGDAVSPAARLLAGVISVLGQPLGVGQGNNPTCQAARAIAMWSHTDPDYLLQLVAWAARDNDVRMPFEGEAVSSEGLAAGLAQGELLDVDPVSAILVPHLDRIYMEMGRRCAVRGGDPHAWINPEMHGWWVGRTFNIVVDVPTGKLVDIEGFVSSFYAAFHPDHNNNQPVIHPSPVGIAITDSAARFVGWHAIAIIRVARDPSGEVRVYFFNPNNDSGQDWGNGIQVSTSGHGEAYGESSVPISDFAARLYIFHTDPPKPDAVLPVEQAEIDAVRDKIIASWGRDRV